MSDSIKHECGIAFIRLLKPFSYYIEKYGSPLYAVKKLYILMEKQHNRGQDGAGVAVIKYDIPPGNRYISRHRSTASKAVQDIFEHIQLRYLEITKDHPDKVNDIDWLKLHVPFIGELLLGHLRYGTHGKNSIENVHPFLRQNNWMTRNLVIAGNFNMTNVNEMIEQLLELGMHPKESSDTVTVLEKIGHFLDSENQRLFEKFKLEGFNNVEISELIASEMNVANILTRSAKTWDGGYTIAGLMGHGDAFIMRDPAGIRPAFYYQDEEFLVAASERPAIQSAFNVPVESIQEIKPGHALIIKKNGKVTEEMFRQPEPRKSCSFERIYFSRGNDTDIYRERKKLGNLTVPDILKAVDYDIPNTVFSFIPNTAEVAYYGMIEGLESYIRNLQKDFIASGNKDLDELNRLINLRVRMEKVALKDAKLRTFITQDSERDELVSHVYDVTYGVIQKGQDNLVVIDDSIVRGTTLKQSILKILDRLKPKKIIVVSSAPQIRYPDCYGIDMSRMGEFVAFQAAISLLKKMGMDFKIQEVYEKCKLQMTMKIESQRNLVKEIYEMFSYEEISDEIARIITPQGISAEVGVIFQKLENLPIACPNHLGDWYFSGNYPTPGGNRLVNQAFINYVEGNVGRSYEKFSDIKEMESDHEGAEDTISYNK